MQPFTFRSLKQILLLNGNEIYLPYFPWGKCTYTQQSNKRYAVIARGKETSDSLEDKDAETRYTMMLATLEEAHPLKYNLGF